MATNPMLAHDQARAERYGTLFNLGRPATERNQLRMEIPSNPLSLWLIYILCKKLAAVRM
jgi:hypothetical protein